MGSPPNNELLWIGAVVGIAGGLLGIVSVIFSMAIHWRNRRRIDFRLITAKIYYERWQKGHVDSAPPGPVPGEKCWWLKVGAWRTALRVIEFTIKNEYPVEVSIGRIVIDGWMFSDEYSHAMYETQGQYRVFDLYTGERVSLEKYRKISPKGLYGLRVEVLDQATSGWWSRGSRHEVKLRRRCSIEFQTDVGAFKKQIKFASPEEAKEGVSQVYHWSNLIEPSVNASTGMPAPQGVRYGYKFQQTWLVKLRRWWYSPRARRWRGIVAWSRLVMTKALNAMRIPPL